MMYVDKLFSTSLCSARQCPYVFEAIAALAEMGLSSKEFSLLFSQVSAASYFIIWKGSMVSEDEYSLILARTDRYQLCSISWLGIMFAIRF